MRKMLIAAFGLIFAVGCLPQRYAIDVTKIEGCEDFDWNGRVTVRKTWHGLFKGYTVDLIKLEAKDGRAILFDTSRGGVETYVKVKVEKRLQEIDVAAKVQQTQNSPDQDLQDHRSK